MKRKLLAITIISSFFALAGCAPEIGSKEWCNDLEDKPKGDWSTNEATDYAKHCLFQSREED